MMNEPKIGLMKTCFHLSLCIKLISQSLLFHDSFNSLAATGDNNRLLKTA